ncbi:phosphoribosylanthranilate isomerase [Leptospira ilyithenensis]|uniref:N-(5'-phosphoribosyl)anthranilate isomerase n=1 Tax=Leptospira ilyithenensis TaxID=2484901 RepID=A0A4R9LRL5_9LEPT|nr:phosphoribosylanthranilate isomerase [Leptospira ilyithenensis]TGN10532.1 phosphoribosylanthranilate isomerase [Leptospira ilyithenensis]
MGAKIKICGIRTPEIIQVCADLKVDLIGLNFSPNSPRNIKENEIPNLIRTRHTEGFPKIVFLFYNNEIAEIRSVIEKYEPDYVQFIQGDNKLTTDIWNHYLNNKKLLPSFRISEEVKDESILCPELPFVILDSYKKGLGGGTGESFPWEYVKNVKRPYLLAGGITPENVREALDYLNPFGIDVASGVETDGKKDPEKIRQLVKNVRG